MNLNLRPPNHPRRRTPPRGNGFTLIEFIGVLTIILLLALALVEPVVRTVDIAAVNQETATLKNMTNALVLQVLRNNQIPSEGAWAAAVGNWLPLAPVNITTNTRRYKRAFLIDTNGWLTNLPASGYYTQTTTNGAATPRNARIMIVSSLSAALPVATGRPATAVFTDLWNTSPARLPTNALWAGWKGRADDLLIQRLNLQPLFYQLVLLNRDPSGTAAFSINGGQTNILSGQSGLNSYYLGGSQIDLLTVTYGTTNVLNAGQGSGDGEGGEDDDGGDFGWHGGGGGGTVVTNATVNFQTSVILNRNISYVLEDGTWGGRIGNGPASIAAPAVLSFVTNAQSFLASTNSPRNSGPGAAAGDQQQVLAAMFDFMTVYTLWSGDSNTLHGMTHSQAKNHLSIYNYLTDSAASLGNVAGNTRNINTNSPPVFSGLLY